MVQLHQDQEEFTKRNIEVVAICPESEEKIQSYLDKQDLYFTLVADPSHKLADQMNQQVKILKLGRMPAQILISPTGQLIFEHHSRNMKDIIGNQKIFELVQSHPE